MKKYELIELPDGKLMKIQNLKKCSECKQVPWCTMFDMHEYGHKKECSRS